MRNDGQFAVRLLALAGMSLLVAWAILEGPRKLTDWLELAAKTAGALAPLTIFGAWLYKPWKKFLADINDGIATANGVKLCLDEVQRKVTEVSTHVLPNGGGSITDKIDNISTSMNGLTKAVNLANLRARASWVASPVGTYECDPSGLCIYANPALCQLFGLAEEEMLKSGWVLAIIPQERLSVVERWRAMTAARVPYSDEYTIVNQLTGVMTRVTTSATMHEDDKGEIIGYIGTVTVKDTISHGSTTSASPRT